jgi:hypothetical protein
VGEPMTFGLQYSLGAAVAGCGSESPWVSGRVAYPAFLTMEQV